MTWSLALASLFLGLAAMPHCALMCGAPCAAMTAGGPQGPWLARTWLFHSGRVLGYSTAGAVAAISVASLGAWAQASPALRPLWTLLHLLFLFLGLWWLIQGRQPTWLLQRSGVAGPAPLRWSARSHARPAAAKLWRPSAAGLAWVAWPCAVLQAALLLAALANTAMGGAAVMLVFALTSAPGLMLAPWAMARWRRWRGPSAARGEVATLGFRVAGLGLVLVSSGALTHGLWQRLVAWCGI
jgi:uncharacterized protein